MNSGKYLSLDTSSLSFRGSEYVQVCLEKGSPRSHFVILPRFKLRSKGAPVQLTDQILLSGGEESLPFSLHVSNRSYMEGNAFAVVASSLYSSQWRVILYDKVDDEDMRPQELGRIAGGTDPWLKYNHEGLRGGSCIRLLHLESNSWLQYDPSGTRNSSLVTLQYSDLNEKNMEESNDKALSADSLWEVERTCIYEGGSIRWSDHIVLRHVISGKYLAVSSQTQHSPVSCSRANPSANNHSTRYNHMLTQDEPQALKFIPTAVMNQQ
jgi:hypothetical protein